MTSPKLILIADDHDLIREGLVARIQKHSDWSVCGQAKDGHEALSLATQFKPHVAVLDVGLPGLNGIEVTREILKTLPGTEVLIMTVYESESIVIDAAKAGAKGFLLKTDSAQLIEPAIANLLNHETYVSKFAANCLWSGVQHLEQHGESPVPLRQRLSIREIEVLQAIAEGLSSKEIALRLGISTKTVDAHRSNLTHKLGTHSIAELVRLAIREKLIEP